MTDDNTTLTPRRDVVENPEFSAFARRIVRAYAKRVAAGDIEALADLVGLSETLDTAISDAVAGLRAEPYRYSWADIADRLGITRQAAQQRWGTDIPQQRRTPNPVRANRSMPFRPPADLFDAAPYRRSGGLR